MSGFHGAFATGVASQQGTLTLPDTWFRPPFWDLLMLQLLRPIPRTCHVFTRLFTSNTPWYFLDLASCRRFVIKVCLFSDGLEHFLFTTTTIWLPKYPKAEISCKSCKNKRSFVKVNRDAFQQILMFSLFCVFCARTSVSCRRFVIKVCLFSDGLEHFLFTTTTIWLPKYPKAEISCKSCKTIQTDVPKFRFTELGSNLANSL